MSHAFKHFVLITRHRHMVIRNGFHMGIFWHCLKHDLSKYGWKEFWTSAKYYRGNFSPVFAERMHNDYFSTICQHHTKRNPHHWEYWTDFFCGRVVIKTMPWKYATEYVCDMLSASKNYNPKEFKPETTYNYFIKHKDHFYATRATREYIEWCLSKYKESGWKELKKKNTKKMYQEICSKYPDVEILEELNLSLDIPKSEKDAFIKKE